MSSHNMHGVAKTLIVIRHAKSSWNNSRLGDAERPLNKRGRRDGPRMAKFLAEQGLKPERLLVSDAVRARATAEFLVDAFGLGEHEIDYEPRLYLAGVNGLYDLIRESPDSEGLALVAHNPGITDLVNSLGERVITQNVPTFGVAAFEIPINDWHELRPGMGNLTGFHTPKTISR